MRLLRLEVRHWRGLEHVCLEDLAADLNLVVGPNESGKSRLFEALRFALFERHKGESEEKKKLRTWGGGESPEVSIAFSASGHDWKLTKRFLKGASARLEGGGQVRLDDDAEQKLRELWGTQEIKGRKDIDQFLGLWPLLWVQQGRAGLAPHLDMNADTRARLTDALAMHVHEVAAGEAGQRLMARVDEERARYWTATGKETGELADARRRREKAAVAFEEATKKREAARAAVVELARIEAKLGEGEAKLRALQGDIQKARAMARDAKERASSLKTRELEAAALRSRRQVALERRAEHDAALKELERRANEARERASSMAEMKARFEASSREREDARRGVDDALGRADTARKQQLRSRRRERRTEALAAVARANEALGQAREHERQIRQLKDELALLRIGPAEMMALRRAKETFARANAALAAASARVTVRATRPVSVDGDVLGEGETREYRLDEPRSFQIGDVALVHVAPAGAELHRLRDEEADAKLALDSLLGDLIVASVTDAEDRHRRRIEVEASLSQRGAALMDVVRLESELRTSEAELAAQGQDEELEPPLPVDESDRLVTLMEEDLAGARALRDAVDRAVSDIHSNTAVAESRLVDALAQEASARSRLLALTPAGQIDVEMQSAEEAWTSAEALVEASRAELRRHGDVERETDLEREEKVLTQAEKAHREDQDRKIALETTVRHFGAEAVHEDVQEAEAHLSVSSAELDRVLRRAAAARALAEALASAREEVQQKLVAPVREKIEPYLEGLLPGVQLEIDEEWAVRGLRTRSQAEDFDALSGGAKEQVSLLVRLGLAEVLGSGEPLPIVLDDCLVNTDPERQRDMLRILYRASKKQQILLFSCHDVAFERLGATRRYDLPARRAR